MWSPSGAVGRGALGSTRSPACFCFVFADLTLRPEVATQTLPGAALATPSPALRWVGAAAHPGPLHTGARPRFRHLPPPQGFLLKWKGEASATRKDPFLCKTAFYFGFCTAGNFRQGEVGRGVVCRGNEAAKRDAHSIFPRASLPVPHGFLPCQDIWEWLIQLPRNATWECMTQTPAAIYWGPHYQRKDYCPATGRGMNPGECAKIM